MGVAGSGKTTVGQKMAQVLLIPFYDADDYHEYKNIEKMKSGLQLNDLDRKPWLSLLALKIKKWNLCGDAILACSALKKKYQNVLSQGNEVTFIFLDGRYEIITERLSKRKNHFFKKEMLENQFSILEVPNNCVRIPVDQSIDGICLMISDNLKKIVNEK